MWVADAPWATRARGKTAPPDGVCPPGDVWRLTTAQPPVATRSQALDRARARASQARVAHCIREGNSRVPSSATYTAVVIEVLVDRDSGQITPVRAVIAADAGQVIDPSGLANQLEGGLIQSTSWTLKEQVRFDRVRVTSTDWESYPILRFPEVPTVETILIDRPGEPYLGSGEAAQPPTPAAIANAVFDAVGVRLRDVPFTPDRVRGALAAT
jgi:CO/xanthine dehydrogenase Mo-binding subunit